MVTTKEKERRINVYFSNRHEDNELWEFIEQYLLEHPKYERSYVLKYFARLGMESYQRSQRRKHKSNGTVPAPSHQVASRSRGNTPQSSIKKIPPVQPSRLKEAPFLASQPQINDESTGGFEIVEINHDDKAAAFLQKINSKL